MEFTGRMLIFRPLTVAPSRMRMNSLISGVIILTQKGNGVDTFLMLEENNDVIIFLPAI